ncbi:death on curing protein [Cohaesibacter marisflavi]|uniref:Death on curing protein n=1 Tax=Cohaesibacter marisflavi TaxID=655353 RepID=A0A1I5NJF0_9HYPH|nr:type II toxin-antitoxin system death-on-curing family toxin [Cohaesibacter marisflavi]SFP21899.1 death on curing protein [Cohaesibacter marisflavi]
MTDPKWVSEELVARLHECVIDIGGGAQGIRDTGLLASALARPQNLYAYGEDDVFQLAASYAESIARNHPFIDGNKRTAFQSADLFLALNGYDLDAARGVEHADIMEKLAQGLIYRDEAAEHFQAYCHNDES